jgi:hypothetical protein
MGTTCTVLLIRGSETFIGHVGDSRIYLQTNGKLHRITKDHSFVQTLVDQGLISDSEAESHPRKNELLKALGIRDTVEPEVSSAPIQASAGDCFMMCSDGLCGLVDDNAMESVLGSNQAIDDKTDKLIAMAKSAGGNDNITVAVIDIESSPFTTSVFVDLSPKESTATTGEMGTFAATQEIGGLAESSKAEVPLWKNPKVLAITGVVVVILTVFLFFNPFSGDNPTLNPTDSLNTSSQNLQSTEEPKDCSSGYYSVEIGQDGVSNMGQATDTLLERVGKDTYKRECLIYKKKDGSEQTGEKVADINEVHPGEIVSLNCDCLSSGSAESNGQIVSPSGSNQHNTDQDENSGSDVEQLKIDSNKTDSVDPKKEIETPGDTEIDKGGQEEKTDEGDGKIQ